MESIKSGRRKLITAKKLPYALQTKRKLRRENVTDIFKFHLQKLSETMRDDKSIEQTNNILNSVSSGHYKHMQKTTN